MRQADVTHDSRENVVKVVRNSARQRSQAFHALRKRDLGPQLLFLGDVRVDRENALGPAL